MKFERVARSEEVFAPRFLRVEVQGRPVLLTRLSDGTVTAFDPICPHQQNPMDEGSLWEDEIDCPYRHYTYDARTGRNLFPANVFPADRAARVLGVPVFEVAEEDGWAGTHAHTIHFHGVHPAGMDGVFEVVEPGGEFTYEFDAEPFGLHLHHCHVPPLRRHIHKGLYGVFIVDPPEPRPPARELVMVMNGFDTNLDGENEVYAVNTVGLPLCPPSHPVAGGRAGPDLSCQPDRERGRKRRWWPSPLPGPAGAGWSDWWWRWRPRWGPSSSCARPGSRGCCGPSRPPSPNSPSSGSPSPPAS